MPPAAIRFKVQRRPGTQERVDLAFVWPSLDAARSDASSRCRPTRPTSTDRLFVTIAGERQHAVAGRAAQDDLSALLSTPRRSSAPTGSACTRFRDGTPYQGEDLIYDPARAGALPAPLHARRIAPTPGMCLHERRIGGADVTVRFPRAWLDDWRGGRRRHRPADRGLPADADAG